MLSKSERTLPQRQRLRLKLKLT